MRGYRPHGGSRRTACFSLGALIADANALHDALGGDEESVLIGSDWGAEAAYGAAAFAPERWRRLVALAIPPLSMDARLFADFEQLRRFFYMFLFTQPAAEEIVAADGMAFIDRLWADWSPGYDATEDLAFAKDSIREREHLTAAIGYYRAALGAPASSGEVRGRAGSAGARSPAADALPARRSTTAASGSTWCRDAEAALSPGSRLSVVEDAGHFLHLERPELSTRRSSAWVYCDR